VAVPPSVLQKPRGGLLGGGKRALEEENAELRGALAAIGAVEREQRELGDASVPFRYDVHAVIFSRDAVGLETYLHHQLAERRVNLVNPRREFFYATPAEVREILSRLDGNNVLSFAEDPEALEWRQSENMRPAGASSAAAVGSGADR